MKTISIIMVLLLSACVTEKIPVPNDPDYSPVLARSAMPQPISNGAIYQVSTGMALFSDVKARRVGDILLVTLEENTNSSKTATTSVEKKNATAINEASVFGKTETATTNGLINGIAKAVSNSPISFLTDIESSVDFEGDTKSDQTNRLNGNISVTVTDVLSNGTLVIRGEKWMTLNRGREYIRITGLVRTQDISPSNMVSSTKIADARIQFSGTGDLAETNNPSWLTKFFIGSIWPF